MSDCFITTGFKVAPPVAIKPGAAKALELEALFTQHLDKKPGGDVEKVV